MSNAAIYFFRTTSLSAIANKTHGIDPNETLPEFWTDAIREGKAVLVKSLGGVETIISQA